MLHFSSVVKFILLICFVATQAIFFPVAAKASDKSNSLEAKRLQLQNIGIPFDSTCSEIIKNGTDDNSVVALVKQPRPWKTLIDSAGFPSWFAAMPLAISKGNHLYRDSYTSGLWGLTLPVALKYGLVVDKNYDERYDPRKSTMAALLYWNDLRKLYPSEWMTLLAFVNTPAVISNAKGCVSEKLEVSKSNDETTFWSYYNCSSLLKPEFPDNFIKVLCAMDDNRHEDEFVMWPSVLLEKPVFITLLCSQTGISESLFREYNPSVLSSDKIDAGRIIYVSNELAAKLKLEINAVYDTSNALIMQQEAEFQKAKSAAMAPKLYIVKQGDTLGAIARQYHVYVADIKRWNGLKSDIISIGQRLKIYKK